MRTHEYWANLPVEKFGAELQTKVGSYDSIVGGLGRADMWRRAARALYGQDPEGGTSLALALTFEGDEGELVQARADFFGMFIRARGVLATATTPTYTARPRAYDAQTTELVGIMNAIIDFALHQGVEATLIETQKNADYLGEGWTGVYWDPTKGEIVARDPETGVTANEGDVLVETYRPDQIIRDPSCLSWNHDWICVRRVRSRWNVAAEYPAHRDVVLNAPPPGTDQASLSTLDGYASAQTTTVFEDQITVYEFWHRPTAAIPGGRATIMVDGVAIADGPNPYGYIPVIPLVPIKYLDAAFGFAESWKVLALQALVDSATTQAGSMQENFGMTSVVAPPGAAIETEALSKGMRALYALQAIEPLSTQGKGVENAVAWSNHLVSTMTQIMAMNETSLGQGSTSASGASITAQVNVSAQNNSGIVRAYLEHFEKVLCAIVKVYQQFASVERSTRIVGKLNSGKVVRWKGETLAAIDGVDVELMGTAARTTAARYQFMSDMVTAGLVTDVDTAMQVWSTGRIEPLFDGPEAREANIERENELLQNGTAPIVLMQDHHADHIRRHASLLFDPSVRDNPQLVQLVQQHIYEHAGTWQSAMTDPAGMAILMATGQQPPPAPPPMPMAPGVPGVPGAPVDPAAQPPTGAPLPDATTAPQEPTETGLPAPAQGPDARPIPVSY